MNPVSNEYSQSMESKKFTTYRPKEDYHVEYQRMSSLADIMDAEETENWIDKHSTAVAEWSTRKAGKKERWEIDKAGEASIEIRYHHRSN